MYGNGLRDLTHPHSKILGTPLQLTDLMSLNAVREGRMRGNNIVIKHAAKREETTRRASNETKNHRTAVKVEFDKSFCGLSTRGGQIKLAKSQTNETL